MSLLTLRFALALLVGCSALRGAEEQRGSNSVQKVIQMLNDMLAKAKSDKNVEEINFAQFTQWCTDEEANLDTSIKASGESIETLSAGIAKLDSEVKELGDSIGTLQMDLAKYSADLKSTVSEREKEHAEFLAEQEDFSESVSAIERAILVLQKQNYDRTGASAALLQLSQNAQLPQNAKAMLQAFVGMMDSSDDSESSGAPSAPEANAYEFQSGSIIDLLKKLRDDFNKKLDDCQKEEMNSKHASDMVVQDLKDSEENAKRDLGEKTVIKEKKAEAMALTKKELNEATASKAEDESTLKDMKAECMEKKLSFETKQQLREEEIEAVSKAVEILSNPELMSGTKHLSFAQMASKTSAFAQFLNSGAASEEGIRRKLREYLAQRAKKLHSQNLELLAEKLEADPFVKVKKMIEQMITRLLEESKEDADHEGFCDKEMGESKITRSKLTEDIDGLSAAVEEGQAQIILLKQDSGKLTAEVAELDAAMIEATKMRNTEKAKNTEVVEDAKQAIGAVEAATAILKDFYKKASIATALVQQKPKFEEGMQTFGSTFTGQQE
jgi:hypothetical protein